MSDTSSALPANHADPFSAREDRLRSARFRQEREAHWHRLDELVRRAESAGIHSLSYEEVQDLTATYRQAMNSLSVMRVMSLDRAVRDYLENLCARACLVIYAPQEGLGGLISRLFVSGIPQAVRRSALPLLIGFLALALGAVMGYLLYQDNQDWFYRLHGNEPRSPEATVQYLKSTLYHAPGQESELADFAASLFSHNTIIAFMIFTLGIVFSVPSFMLTFYNGLHLGTFFAVFAEKDLGYDLFAWLSIHGVTELGAIIIACAGGARLGLAVLLPGQQTRREALRRAAHDAVKLAILAALMLIVAGILEGLFRQIVQSAPLRIIIGWGIGVLWILWLSLSGHEKTTRKVAAS